VSKLIPYIGGKRLLAKHILGRMPQHQTYCEVFGGGGTILLEKSPSEREVFNDINKELTNLFRVVKHHIEEFVKEIRWNLKNRNEFMAAQQSNPIYLTDIQRAANFYYLLRCAFGAKLPHNSHFAGGG